MKRTKRTLAAILAALLTLSLAGCSGSGGAIASETPGESENAEGAGNTGKAENNGTSPASRDDFQKNLHQTDELYFLETEDGYYFSWGSLFYIDKETGNTTRVCGKPDCDHTTEDCNSRIRADYLLGQGDGGPIYYVGVQTDPKAVWSVS